MKPILFFDVETTGLPEWKMPSGHESQPHLVQLGAVLADEETQEVISTLDLIIKPDGWEIPQETVDVHGVTQEKALAVGVPEKLAIQMFMALWGNHKRVAHNRTFDQRLLRIGLKRFGFSEQEQELWAEKDNFDCSMLLAKPIMKMEPKNKFGFKPPKLEEAYEYFTGKNIENAHTALADATACMEVYFVMVKAEQAAA